jgi:hypothetical protein
MVLGRKTRQSSRRARPSCSAASTFLVRLLGHEPEMAADDLGEYLRHQRRLAGTGHTRHRRQYVERHVDGHMVQIVA